jgi:hypothetical protein
LLLLMPAPAPALPGGVAGRLLLLPLGPAAAAAGGAGGCGGGGCAQSYSACAMALP